MEPVVGGVVVVAATGTQKMAGRKRKANGAMVVSATDAAAAAQTAAPGAPTGAPEDRDPLRAVLFPHTREQRARVFDVARAWLEKLDQVYPKLRPMCADTFRRALEFDDLDFAHFIFFI